MSEPKTPNPPLRDLVGDVHYLLWFLVPLAVAGVGFALFAWVHPPQVPIALPEWTPRAVAAREAAARYAMGTTFLALVAACGAAALFGLTVVWRSVPRAQAWLVIGIGAFVAIWLARSLWGGESLVDHLGKDVFTATVDRYAACGEAGCPEATPEAIRARLKEAGCGRLVNLGKASCRGTPLLRLEIDLLNTLAIGAAVLAALAACTLMWHEPQRRGRESAQRGQRELAERRTMLKHLLFAAAAALLAGLYAMRAWREWPLVFFGDPKKDAAARAYAQLVGATINYQAVHFVLILAAIFLPVALVLNRQGAGAHGGEAAQAGWSEFKEFAKKLGAILAPLLAGPVPELVAKLKTLF